MKERPILFNAEMVRAILDGRKTQTRRAVNPQPSAEHSWHGWIIESTDHKNEGKACWAIGESPLLNKPHRVMPPFGKVGDRLWVRETWSVISHTFNDDGLMVTWTPDRPSVQVKEMPSGNGYYTGHVIYRADGGMEWSDDDGCHTEKSFWHPSIHMPRSACRIILEITSVRVERVQDISESDAAAEGFDIPAADGQGWKFNAKHNFKFTWDRIYKNWSENPWVWVVEFKVLTTDGVVRERAA